MSVIVLVRLIRVVIVLADYLRPLRLSRKSIALPMSKRIQPEMYLDLELDIVLCAYFISSNSYHANNRTTAYLFAEIKRLRSHMG